MNTDINSMLTPTGLKVNSESPNHSRIVLEPLEPGYGHTLGNALRRILLSSMPGSAITEVGIDNYKTGNLLICLEHHDPSPNYTIFRSHYFFNKRRYPITVRFRI